MKEIESEDESKNVKENESEIKNMTVRESERPQES